MAMPHRVPHIMQVHKSNRMPCNLLFFDTETHDKPGFKQKNISRQVLNFGYAYSYYMKDGVKTKEKWSRFTSSKEFWKIVKAATNRDAPLYCFAHNLGFDLTILDFWSWADNEDFNCDYFVDSDPPTFISGHINNRKVLLIDTLNYWRNSLEDIGKSVGLEKLRRPNKTDSKIYWENYAKRDVEVLERAVSQLMGYLRDNDLGQFGLSAASMAMSSYKRRFMHTPIYIHDNRHAMQTERKAYFGGLCDCLYVGKVNNKTLYKLDVNSMYPYVMLGEYPTKLIDYALKPYISSVYHHMREKATVAKVRIRSTRNVYPVRYNGRLCYCNGNFDTYLCGPELKPALQNGDIELIHSVNYYEKAKIFDKYVEFFWKERQRFKLAGDTVRTYFVKIFMNSLYGKFGQLGYDSCLLSTDKLKELYDQYGKKFPNCYNDLTPLLNSVLSETNWQPLGLGKTLTLRRINNHVKVKVPNGEHNESFPAIAAYVTSNARKYLLDLIACCGQFHVYYVDTDSLIVDEFGLNKLRQHNHLSDSQLGRLKLEGESRDSYFNAPKDYMFGNEVKQKGIRRDAKLIAPNTYTQIQFEGIKSILRRGGDAYVDVKTITKHVSREYNKGIVQASHWVKPFCLTLDSQEVDKPEPLSNEYD